ncbi:Cation/H+ exchanger [Xylogone sp. PMI_703]|nr:Cation/H+ exchanger [Xylogone sp. PMI_703]
MPTLAITNFNLICWVLGGFISLFGLVSYLLKEKFYLSEALISLLAGFTLSPYVLNIIRPLDIANGSMTDLNSITLDFSRLVLGIQLVLTGVQLPSRYLKTEYKSLLVVLGPILACMWLLSSLITWAIVPNISFLHALAIGACITPTDPVLSSGIVKGTFAEKNVPKDLQRLIVAESGANDGLGYPFLFLALYIMKHLGNEDTKQTGSIKKIAYLWFGETWTYIILLSIIYGIAVGWAARELLHWTEKKNFVDRESFVVFSIALALFIIGSCGFIGSDDVLACFIAGNIFTWDDWFRLKTLEDSLQPTLDMLLNLSIFMWFGAVCPWSKFVETDIISINRLLLLSSVIILCRRLPVVFALRRFIHQIEDNRQAIFVGFFGPIGVSAIFYLYLALEFLDTLVDYNGIQRTDAANLAELMTIVVWFITISSIICYGLSIPLGKLGFHLPQSLLQTLNRRGIDSGYITGSVLVGSTITSVTQYGTILFSNREELDP